MKSFSVAYGMARRARGLSGRASEALQGEEDMIAAIRKRREKVEPDYTPEALELEEPVEDPAAERKARIASILGR